MTAAIQAGPDGKRTFFRGCFAAVFCEILFGFSFLFTKTAVGSVTPFDLLAWRFAVAAGLMGLLIALRAVKVDFRNKPLLPLLKMGLLFPGWYYVLEAYGVMRLAASETGIIVASVPGVTLLLSILFLGERPSKLRVCGVILSIGGVVLCAVAKWGNATFSPLGYLLVTSAILGFCAYTILARKATVYTTAEKTAVQLAEGFAIYFSAALIQHWTKGGVGELLLLPVRDPALLRSALYLGAACSVGSMLLCNFSINCIGPARFTSFIGVETLVAMAAGILLLQESLGRLQLLGAAVVIAGVYLANSRRAA